MDCRLDSVWRAVRRLLPCVMAAAASCLLRKHLDGVEAAHDEPDEEEHETNDPTRAQARVAGATPFGSGS